MKRISIRELHENTGMLVREARRLGGLIVTERGVPIARIEPVDLRAPVNPFRNRKLLPRYAEFALSKPIKLEGRPHEFVFRVKGNSGWARISSSKSCKAAS